MIMGTSLFHFVTRHAFDRRTERPSHYRALHYMQSHGKNATVLSAVIYKQCENCEKITGGWQIWGEAPQAPRGWALGRDVPSSIRVGLGRGCAPSPEIFLTF